MVAIVNSLIKLFLAVIKILLDYKADHTADPETAREVFDNDIQEMQAAIGSNDSDTVNRLFEQLRSGAVAAGAITGTSQTGDNSDPGRSGDSADGQRVLQGESSVAIGAVPDRERATFAPPGVPKRKETNRVIFHHTATSAPTTIEEIHAWHTDLKRPGGPMLFIGYHYFIPKTGRFEAGRKLQLVGAHARGRNADSIGICFEGHLGREKLTGSQELEAMRLYHDLCRAYSKELAIEFHHGRCPGKYLDRQVFTKMLEASI